MTPGGHAYGRSTQNRRRKKTRPPVKTTQTAAPAATGQADVSRPASSSVTFKTAASRPAGATLSIHPEDYAYIYHDLRRIFVVAGALFVVLIVLTFIIK